MTFGLVNYSYNMNFSYSSNNNFCSQINDDQMPDQNPVQNMQGMAMIFGGMDLLDDGQINGSILQNLIGLSQKQSNQQEFFSSVAEISQQLSMIQMLMIVLIDIMMSMKGMSQQLNNPYGIQPGTSGAYARYGNNEAYAYSSSDGTCKNGAVYPNYNDTECNIPGAKPAYIADSDWSKIKQLDPRMQAKVCELYERANAQGINFHISSGYRSREQQERIYNSARPGYAAKPGCSQHELGCAIDVKASTSTKQALGQIWEAMGNKWGQRFRKSEDWHFDIRSA